MSRAEEPLTPYVSVDVAVVDLDAAMAELHDGLGAEWGEVVPVAGGGREVWQDAVAPVVHLIERPGVEAPHVLHISCPADDVARAAARFAELGWTGAGDGVFAGPDSGMRVRVLDAAGPEVARVGRPPAEPGPDRLGLVQVCVVAQDIDAAVAELRAAGVVLSQTAVFELGDSVMNTVLGRDYPYVEVIRSTPGSDWVNDASQIDHVCWWVADWEADLDRLVAAGVPIEVDYRDYPTPYTFHRAPASGLRLEMFAAEVGRMVPTYFAFD